MIEIMTCVELQVHDGLAKVKLFLQRVQLFVEVSNVVQYIVVGLIQVGLAKL
jgi:hypothetical protein